MQVTVFKEGGADGASTSAERADGPAGADEPAESTEKCELYREIALEGDEVLVLGRITRLAVHDDVVGAPMEKRTGPIRMKEELQVLCIRA